jgi:hypothetical protein
VVSEKKKSDKFDDATVLESTLERFKNSWDYASRQYHDKWEENWKLYNNIRTRRSHSGVIKTFVPLVNSSINTMVASLFNSDPKFTFIPNHPDQESQTDILSELIADFSRRDGWNQKNTTNGRQCFITGNGPVFYSWQSSDEGDYIHKEVVAVRDFICDPTAKSPDCWKWAGRRYLTSKEELESEKVIDIKTGELVPRYSNLGNISAQSGESGQELDKQRKDSLLGSVSPETKEQIEIIEIWDKDRVVSVAGRSTVIENVENPYKTKARLNYENQELNHEIMRMTIWAQTGTDIGEFSENEPEIEGFIPFALMRDYIDESLVYGTSDVDLIKGQQELLNDLTEMYVEAIMYQLYPEKTLDPKFATWVDDIDPVPGKVYPLPQGAMVWNTPAAIPINAFNERMNIKNEIRETVAIDQVMKGVTSATSQTATEIKAQLSQSGNRIEMKARNLENDFFLQEGKICLKLIRLYITEPQWVRTMGDAGVDFKEFDPSQFLGEYTPMVQLDISRELERSKTQQAYEKAFQIVIQDPTNNLAAAKEAIYPKMLPELSEAEIQNIITPPTPEGLPTSQQNTNDANNIDPTLNVTGSVPGSAAPMGMPLGGDYLPPEAFVPGIEAMGGM